MAKIKAKGKDKDRDDNGKKGNDKKMPAFLKGKKK